MQIFRYIDINGWILVSTVGKTQLNSTYPSFCELELCVCGCMRLRVIALTSTDDSNDDSTNNNKIYNKHSDHVGNLMWRNAANCCTLIRKKPLIVRLLPLCPQAKWWHMVHGWTATHCVWQRCANGILVEAGLISAKSSFGCKCSFR